MLEKYKKIYMIGIGGISMSGIAKILKDFGYQVSGSDGSSSYQTDSLEAEGFNVNIGHNPDNITDDIELIVYTAAIHMDNPEIVKAKELGIPMVERSVFLGELTKLYKDTIGVAGTHGKTSTSSMLSTIFVESGLDPSIQIGANLNIINGNYRIGKSDYFIIEACEYRDSYQQFKQKSAIVLNIDADHLDYFKNIENIQKSFEEYVSHLPVNGYLVINRDDERCYKLKDATKAKVITVGSDEKADWYYKNITFNDDGYPSYDAYHNGELIDRIELQVMGTHNVFNSLCAIALSFAYGISFENIKNNIFKYTGASRRMEYKGMINGAKVYDDYGHHPTEIQALLEGIKNKKHNESWAIYEPHTYSRLAKHIAEFAQVLDGFDNVIVTDIYAAREKNEFGIKEDDLLNLMKNENAIHISNQDEIISYLKENVKKGDIILTIGAGNVTKIANKIKEIS